MVPTNNYNCFQPDFWKNTIASNLYTRKTKTFKMLKMKKGWNTNIYCEDHCNYHYGYSSMMWKLVQKFSCNKYTEYQCWNENENKCQKQWPHIRPKYKPPTKEKFLHQMRGTRNQWRLTWNNQSKAGNAKITYSCLQLQNRKVFWHKSVVFLDDLKKKLTWTQGQERIDTPS